ncbi:hypothetical protein [Vreelandella massiliensis]|uniref:hypothetical protein n=1 Tax=Vreelandella massiliensis TaxID=1816686 RepID=UPI00096AB5BB|nr:hypothetical protein [Halomonas massiliensis]
MSADPKENAKKDQRDQREDHYDDANPMPDTHHVNPKAEKDKANPRPETHHVNPKAGKGSDVTDKK